MLKLKLSLSSFTRSEIQGAAIFENNKIDKKKSQHNVLHHGIFQDEKILEMISSLLLEHKSKTIARLKKKKPYERPDSHGQVFVLQFSHCIRNVNSEAENQVPK